MGEDEVKACLKRLGFTFEEVGEDEFWKSRMGPGKHPWPTDDQGPESDQDNTEDDE